MFLCHYLYLYCLYGHHRQVCLEHTLTHSSSHHLFRPSSPFSFRPWHLLNQKYIWFTLSFKAIYDFQPLAQVQTCMTSNCGTYFTKKTCRSGRATIIWFTLSFKAIYDFRPLAQVQVQVLYGLHKNIFEVIYDFQQLSHKFRNACARKHAAGVI